MKIIVCVDNSMGLAFGGKRQSQDRIVRQKILSIVGKNRLFMSEYSAKQFENADSIFIDNDFISKVTSDDFVFIENIKISEQYADEIYLFRWNRNYPADVFFDIDLSNNFKIIKAEDFEGFSHEKITLEVYKRK